MITVDDLRPQLNVAYGMEGMETPAIDALAASGLTFLRAYVQMAVCAPSRNSFLTGRRPDRTRCWNFNSNFRVSGVPKSNGQPWRSLPQWFKENGFLTLSSGKLYHDGPPGQPPRNDFPMSWSEPVWGNGPPIGDAGGCVGAQTRDTQLKYVQRAGPWRGKSMCCVDVDDLASLNDDDNKTQPQSAPGQRVEYDHRLATRTIENLRRAAHLGKAAFIGCGFRRPHLAWRTPQRFQRLYNATALPLPTNRHFAKNVTELAFGMNGPQEQAYALVTGGNDSWRATIERGEATGIKQLPDDLVRVFRASYFASVSFLDFEVRTLCGIRSRYDCVCCAARRLSQAELA